MMNDLYVTINKKTRKVDLPVSFIGNDMENLQKRFVFIFEDEFVNGQARLEYEINGEKNFIVLSKENESYVLPIKNILTKEGNINIQLVIDENETDEGVPTFKSNISYLYCGKSLNAVNEAPDGYEIWIQEANAKLNQMDNFDIYANKVGNVATLSVTNRLGETSEVKIYDGINGSPGPANTLTIGTVEKGEKADASITGDAPNQTLNLVLPKGDKGDTGNQGPQGIAGNDAKINGVNILTIEAGTNISLEQEGSILTINSTGGGGGTSDYNDLTNKPKINNVELNGNKTSNDLGLQPAGNYLTSETDPVFVASASYGITSNDITNWNNKGTYSKPNDGIPSTDLASGVQTSLGKADTALQSISSNDVTTALGYTPYNSSNPNGYTSNTGTITGITMNGASKGTSGVVDLGTVITTHQDISGKLDTSKVKNEASTTAGDVYDVRYINTMLGNIESLLGGI